MYFWNHGVGLKQDNGVPTPWNSDKLEAAFDDINRKIDIRTIDNWRAGNSIPRRKNLLALATIASRNDRVRRKIWAEAFVSHYENKNNEYLETKDYSNLTPSELNESRIPLAIIGLLSIVVLSALLYFDPFQKVSTIDQSGSDIRVQNFQNYTENPRFDLLIKGFESEIIDTLYQIDGVRVNLENSETSKLENINVQCDLTGQENAYGLYCRIISTKGEILWSRRKQFEDPGDFIEIQSEIPGALTQVTNIVISDDAKARMRLLGTKSLDAYIAYLKGRKNLKAWHENRADSLMIDAFQGLSTAIATDPSWLEPKFHIVDIYHHIAAGDIKPFSEITPDKAVERIPGLLSEAADRAANDFAKSKASMNAIYFSTDWTALNNYSKTYVTAATARRGELEWLFEPVILLVTGETELLRSLVTERILKFDFGNGTGHAYAVRSYLLDGNLQKARDRYDSSDLRSFSNRLEQIKGYLLFA